MDEQKVRERAYYLWHKEGSPDGRDQEFWERARLLQEAEDSAPTPAEVVRSPDDKEVDEALDETFPASDPPAYTGAATLKDGTT